MIARYVAVGLFACMVSFSTLAQRSLDSLVSEANAEWMFGQWQAQSENGNTVTLNVSWDLDKHVVILHVKTTDMESKGYTVIEPKAEMPKYYSFDNKGSVGKGSWAMEGSDLVLRVESESADRGPRKMGFIFGGSASEGLKVSMHTIDNSGDLVTPAQATFKFKKQK
jgi:hypothetical protein